MWWIGTVQPCPRHRHEDWGGHGQGLLPESVHPYSHVGRPHGVQGVYQDYLLNISVMFADSFRQCSSGLTHIELTALTGTDVNHILKLHNSQSV